MGMIVGCLVGGHLGDKWGRKPVVILSLVVFVTFGSLSALANDFYSFAVLRALCSVAHGLGTSVNCTFTSEINTTVHKSLEITINGCFFVFGLLWTSILAYFSLSSINSGNWRLLILMASVPGFIALTFVHFLQESPRFCLVNHQFAKAFRIINKAIEKNSQGSGQMLTMEE